MGFLINPYNFAAGTVGGWVELGRTTLGSSNSTISVSSLANKRYLQILGYITGQSIADSILTRVGKTTIDSGSTYAYRDSTNGSADGTDVNQTSMPWMGAALSTPRFINTFVSNYATKEKLFITHEISQNAIGAANTTSRTEQVNKWANTSNEIDICNFIASSGTLNSGSEVVVLGWDPAATHTNNFWTELASVTTLTTGNVDSGTFTAKKYLWIQFELIVNAYDDTGVVIQFNADTAGNYTNRISQNGAGDGTNVSQTSIGTTISGGKRIFGNMFIINNSANEKLVIGHTVVIGTTANSTAEGAGVAPRRVEFVGKWANTASQITKIVLDDTAANFVSGQIKVWGSD